MVAIGGSTMIFTLLLQLAGILAGILLLTLVYFLVIQGVSISSSASKAQSPVQSLDTFLKNKPNSEKKTLRAIIRCASVPPVTPLRYLSVGYTECNLQNMVFEGNITCRNGCLGLGSCVRLCPNDAIIIQNGEVFISDACNGCGRCVHICPKQLISIVPVSESTQVTCAASGINNRQKTCETAKQNYIIDYRNFPESGFKILNKWGILKKKSR
jgi:ferredoxin